MEGINTTDAILSRNYPKAHFEQKDKVREKQAAIGITRLKMDRVKELLVPVQPISLMINYAEKL